MITFDTDYKDKKPIEVWEVTNKGVVIDTKGDNLVMAGVRPNYEQRVIPRQGVYLLEGKPVETKEFHPADARCDGCGAPMITNDKWCECEYCGGGVQEKKPIHKPRELTAEKIRVLSNMHKGVQIMNPLRTFTLV